MLAYTVLAGIESKLVDTVVVTTDDEKIKEVAIEYGAEVPFLRPAEISNDKAHTPDAVEHAVSFYEKELKKYYDIVVTLQPTSPFRNGKHIDEAIIKIFGDTTLDSLISIKKQDYPPWWMFKLNKNRLQPCFNYGEDVNVFNLERQQFPKVYRPNGAIYITWRKYLLENNAIVNPENNGYYIMSENDSIDIDNMPDLFAARYEIEKQLKDMVQTNT
jgi:CMP-N-acetylneuraminic acid synthetase